MNIWDYKVTMDEIMLNKCHWFYSSGLRFFKEQPYVAQNLIWKSLIGKKLIGQAIHYFVNSTN